MKDKIIAELKKITDPEIGINIYDMGFIYQIDITDKKVTIDMTLTTPNCPVAKVLPLEVKEAIKSLGFEDVTINLVWEPTWSFDKMSEDAKLALGMI